MDSDVQDLFERHQNNSSAGNIARSGSDPAPPLASVGPTVASFGPPSSLSAASVGNQNQQQQPRITTANGLQQLIASLQGQANIPSSIGGSMSSNGQAQSPQGQQGPMANGLGLLSVLQNALNPSVVSPNGSSNSNAGSGSTQNLSSIVSNPGTAGGNTASFLGGVLQQLQSPQNNQQEQQKQQQMQALLQQVNNGSQGSNGGLASAVATLLQQIQRGNNTATNPAQQQPSPEVIRQNLLLKIVELSQAYANQPQPNDTRGMAISTCIKLLLVLGKQELNQEASPNNARSST